MASALERAARAAFDSDWPDCGANDPEWIASRETYVNNVRAVLMAARDEMRDERNGKVFNRSSAETVDAILNEKDTTND